MSATPVIAALLVAAAAAVIWWGRPEPGGASAPADDGRHVRPQSAGLDAIGLPIAPAASGLTMTTLARLPDDLVVPPAAKKRSLIIRTVLGQVEIKAEYEDTGTVVDLADWMTDRLGRLGWRAAMATGTAAGAVERVFYKSGDTLYLCLKPAAQRVNILVVIRRATSERPPAG